MERKIKTVGVFCGSRDGADPVFRREAARLGRCLAKCGITMVYGGGKAGLMGAVSDAMLMEQGHIIGIIPDFMRDVELQHPDVEDMRVVGSMPERKSMMIDLADAVIAMPGGYGTFEEFAEVLSWNQLGLMSKPCILFNVKGFYDPLMQFFENSVREGFIYDTAAASVYCCGDVDEIMELLQNL